ncbi:MAG: PAS domain S-box protein [Candidatus Thermoplasmatota archaeon]|nr:PAS domain S-box protein [Candidatus Thermoplasmatota archaeon]
MAKKWFSEEVVLDAGAYIRIVDMEGRILLFNKVAEEITGYSKDEVTGKKYLDIFVPPEEKDRILEYKEKALEKGSFDAVFESRILTKSGQQRLMSWRDTILKDAQGVPKAFMSVGIDITDSRKMENEVRDGRDMFSDILNNKSAGIYRICVDRKGSWEKSDCPPYRYVFMNDMYCQMTGLTREEHMADPGATTKLIHPEDFGSFVKSNEEANASQIPFYWEGRVVVGGETRYFRFESHPRVSEEDSILWTGLLVDVTERKQSEEAMKESEEKFRTLVSNIPGAAYRCANDENWTMAFLSGEIEGIVGFPPSDFIGNNVRTFDSIIHPGDRKKVNSAIQKGVNSKKPYDIGYRVLHSNGTVHWVQEFGRGVFDDFGELLWLDGTIFDITEKKRAEKIRQASYRIADAAVRGVEDIFSAVHHEIKEVIGAENFYIAILNEAAGTLHFPYCYDEKDADARGKVSVTRPLRKGLSEYVMEMGKGVLLTSDGLKELEEKGEAKVVGTSPMCWLGVPLADKDTVFGVMAVQNYSHQDAYDERDLDFMEFISGQVASVMGRQELETRRQALLDLMPHGVVENDLQGRVTYSNPAHSRILGYEEGGLVGTFVWDVIAGSEYDKDDLKTYLEYIVREKPDPVPFFAKNVRKDGSVIDVEVDWAYMHGPDGNLKSIVSVVTDITEKLRAQESLRESEEKFRLAFENSRDAIFWADADTGMIVECNRAAENLMEMSREEIIGIHQTEMHPPGKKDYFESMFKQHVDMDGAVDMEVEVLTSSGRMIPVHISSSLHKMGEKTINQGIFRDITSIKEAHAEIVQSERKYRLLVENAPIGIILVGLDGFITEVNPALLSILGSPSAEATKTINALTFPNMVESGISADIKKCMETGQEAGREKPYKTAWGKDIVLRYQLRPVYDVNDNITGVQAIVQDITERKKAEEEMARLNKELEKVLDSKDRSLQTTEQKMSAILSSMADMVFAFDKEGRFTFFHSPDESLLYAPPEHFMGKKHEEVMPASTIKAFSDAFDENRKGRTSRWEYSLDVDGKTMWFSSKMSPIFEKGEYDGSVAVVRDITKRKELEKSLSLQANRNEAILAGIPDIVMEVDEDKVYTWANHAGMKFFGDDIIGKEAAYFFEGEQDTYKKVKPLFNGSEDVFYVESWQRRKDGEKRLLAWWCKALKNKDGKVVGAISTARDITEESANKEQ